MAELLEAAEIDAAVNGQEFVEPKMYLVHQANEDRRRYNEPVSAAEMAVVFTGEEGLPPSGTTMRVFPTNAGGGFRDIKDCDPNRDPMIYPLLFPYGELGMYLKIGMQS